MCQTCQNMKINMISLFLNILGSNIDESIHMLMKVGMQCGYFGSLDIEIIFDLVYPIKLNCVYFFSKHGYITLYVLWWYSFVLICYTCY